MRAPLKNLLVCSALALLPLPATAMTSCAIRDFVPDAADLARLDSGAVGEWDRSFDEKYIDVEDVDGNLWSYYALERRPANADKLVVFLHGFLEFANAWEQQLAYFGEDYHVVALDLKGHRYSSSPDTVAEYDFLELAFELRKLINCLGYESASVVGHDFGGGIAWVMGMLHPDVIDGLVILSVPHPYLFGRALLDPYSDQAERSAYIGHAQSYALADNLAFSSIILSDTSIFRSGFYRGKRILRLVNEVWAPLSGWKQMKHYYRAMPYPANPQDYPALLTPFQNNIYTVRRPTLLMWGLDDPYFAPEAYEGVEALVTELQTVTYPQGTHFLHHDATDLNQRLAAFLEEVYDSP